MPGTNWKQVAEEHLGEYVVVNAYHELNRHPAWRRHIWGKLYVLVESGADGSCRVGTQLYIGEHKVFVHNIISLIVLTADEVEALGLDPTLRTEE